MQWILLTLPFWASCTQIRLVSVKPDTVQKHPGSSEPGCSHFESSFSCGSITLLRRQFRQGRLNIEQFGAICLTFERSSAFLALRQYGNRIVELSPDMCPTANMNNILHAVVSGIAVRLQISLESAEELRRVFLSPVIPNSFAILFCRTTVLLPFVGIRQHRPCDDICHEGAGICREEKGNLQHIVYKAPYQYQRQ